MVFSSFDAKEKFEVQAYVKPEKIEPDTHVPFSGSPRQHPFDPERFVLVADPFTTNTFYYEYRISDIGCAEELPNMTNIDGEAIPMARIWVNQRSVGIRSTPFIVDDITSY